MTGINSVSAKPEEASALDKEDKALTKEEHVINYAKSLSEIDRAIEPFREHRRDLKNSYSENSWLSKKEMSLILKAYRAMKKEEDLDTILEYFNVMKTNNVKV
tara:strand:- start:506 stop:814 length:309 start_codon:yes stop_codon:yes gene_type:complete